MARKEPLGLIFQTGFNLDHNVSQIAITDASIALNGRVGQGFS
jgi:hypothetical protein